MDEHFYSALTALRAQRELGIVVPETVDALARLSLRVDRALERDEDLGIVPSVLTQISTLSSMPVTAAEGLLEELLRNSGVPIPGAKEQLDFIEDVVVARLRSLAAIHEYENAVGQFAAIGSLLDGAIQLSIRAGVPLTKRLAQIIRDFDHAGEPGVLAQVHAELRTGAYKPLRG